MARPDGPLPEGVSVAADPATGDVHLVRGPHFRGVQFHAESVLTQHGFALLRDLVVDLGEHRVVPVDDPSRNLLVALPRRVLH